MHPDTQSLKLDDSTDIIEDGDPFTAKLSFEVITVLCPPTEINRKFYFIKPLFWGVCVWYKESCRAGDWERDDA